MPDKDKLLMQIRNPIADIDILESLTPEQFRTWYLDKMKEYRFFGPGREIPCGGCHQPIPSPEEMTRYFGRTLHLSCFLDIYSKERPKVDNPRTRRYFDLVSKMAAQEIAHPVL